MNPSNPVALVELVTHTSTCINGQNVVLRKREWVRSDDPRRHRETSETRSHCCELGISRGRGRDLPSKRSGSPDEIPRDPHGIGRDLGV